VTAFVYESERYVEGKVQILGVSVEPPEEGKKFIPRVTRDCQEDRPHIKLDSYPVRWLTDPNAALIRVCGLAKTAVAVARGQEPPADYPGKS